MIKNYCGTDCCERCGIRDKCGGCIDTQGRPFGGECIIAGCCIDKGFESCNECNKQECQLKIQILSEFNDLGIKDMPTVTELYALNGEFINLEYCLPGGQTTKIFDDKRVYLGNQLEKIAGDRCYGLTADENYLLVCEYGENGSNPEIVALRRRKNYKINNTIK